MMSNGLTEFQQAYVRLTSDNSLNLNLRRRQCLAERSLASETLVARHDV